MILISPRKPTLKGFKGFEGPKIYTSWEEGVRTHSDEWPNSQLLIIRSYGI